MGALLLGFPFFKAWRPGRHSDTNGGRTAVQIGGVLQYFQRVSNAALANAALVLSSKITRVKATPDPDTFEKYRDTPPISMACFCKSMPSSWQKVVYTPPICITIRLPFVSRYFFRSIRVRGRWNTPYKNRKNIQDGGQRRKTNPKTLGSLLPCGNRCRFSESAISSTPVHPPSEIKSNVEFKTLRWRLLRWHLTLSDTFSETSRGWGFRSSSDLRRAPNTWCCCASDSRDVGVSKNDSEVPFPEKRAILFLRSDLALQDRLLKISKKTAENTLFSRSDLTVQDRILKIRSLASLGWGQNDYLPNLYSRRIIFGNSTCFMCRKENFWGNWYWITWQKLLYLNLFQIN